MTDSHDDDDGAHGVHRPLHWTRDDLKALAIAAALLAVWGGAFALFGFAGLIVPALLLVLTAFVLLIYISRG